MSIQDPIASLRIRPFRPGDERALRAVFHSAIHDIACRDYSPEQIEAWAPSHPDAGSSLQWRQRMQAISPFVVEAGASLVAYADLQPSGYIDHFFVSGSHACRGVGSRLMEYLLATAATQGISTLSSDVSLTAQPFFQRHGFQIVERRIVSVRGVALANALMRRACAA